MGVKEQMAAAVAAVFLNPKEFAEEIQYNGATIIGVPEIGETNTRSEYHNQGTQDNAYFWVSHEDVPDPKVNDEIIHNNKKYKIFRIAEDDGFMFRLQVSANESFLPMRSGLRGLRD